MKDALHIYIQRKLEVVLPYQSIITLEDCGGGKKQVEYHSSPTSNAGELLIKGNVSGYRENNIGGPTSFVPRSNDAIH